MQIPYFWHTMTLNIHDLAQRSIMRKILDQSKNENSRAMYKSCISISEDKHLKLLYPSSFADYNKFQLSGLFPHQFAALTGRCPTALTSPTHWGPQGHPGFIFTASCNDISQPSCRSSSIKLLTLGGFL